MEWFKWARYFDIDAILSLIIGLVFIARGVFFLIRRNSILNRGIIAEGKIVDFKYRYGDKIISRIPIVRFVTKEGEVVEFDYATGTIFSHYSKGMDVTVVFDEKKPNLFFIKGEIDSKAMTIVLLVAGIVMLVIAGKKFLSN